MKKYIGLYVNGTLIWKCANWAEFLKVEKRNKEITIKGEENYSNFCIYRLIKIIIIMVTKYSDCHKADNKYTKAKIQLCLENI